MTHLVGISGSLRRGSYNTALLRAAFENLPEGVTAAIEPLDGLPMYNWDDEQTSGFPPRVAAFRDRIAAADGIVFATPEYNFSVTGALKNAIDWLSRGHPAPIDYKPAAIIGTGGGGGTRRSQHHLREMLRHNSLHVLAEPQVMVPRPRMHFDGLTLEDDRVRADLRLMLDGLVALIERTATSVPLDVRGSVLIVAPDARRAAGLARQVAERAHRPSPTVSTADALETIAGRSVAAAVIDASVDPEARALVMNALRQVHPEAPVVEVSDPFTAGEEIDRALRFQVAEL